MLPHAQPRDLNAALRGATVTGNLRVIDMLLERGAQAPPTILQAAALSPTPIPAATIRTFLKPRGRSEPEDILRTDHSRVRQAPGQ